MLLTESEKYIKVKKTHTKENAINNPENPIGIILHESCRMDKYIRIYQVILQNTLLRIL